ncbi:MAG: methionyl-tRNA formyltransferase [Planctomycetota bacterium]
MRLVMMGTGPFAVPTFESLLDSSHEVLALVTRPAPLNHKRVAVPVNPMRQVAEKRGLPVYDPQSINTDESRDWLAQWQADLLVVCDYGQILSSATLATTRLGGINLHGSLLPRYRGAAPVQWAVYHGDPETGVAVIHMTPLLDGGPILTLRRTAIEPQETAADLEPRLAQLGVPAVLEAMETLAHWDGTSPLGQPQDAAQASKAPRLSKALGQIDWHQSARQIRNQIRAFQPWPGAYTDWLTPKGEWLRLILQQVAEEPLPASDVTPAAGEIVRADQTQLWVATGTGALRIERLQPASKRSMAVAEFLRGHPVQKGQRLGRPPVASETTTAEHRGE